LSRRAKFQPEAVAIANENLYFRLKEALSDLPIKVFAGDEAIAQLAEMQTIDIVLIALLGCRT
jgi:1-deoxy-D-xylulose-5-phosphate reductoisomerase